VAFGTKGSGLTILSRYVLEGLGLDQVKDSSRSSSTRPATSTMVTDGRARRWGRRCRLAGFCGIGAGRARFIAPNADEIGAYAPGTASSSDHPAATAMPADGGDPIGRVVEYVLARPTLSDDIAYALARAIDKGHAALVKRLDQGAETMPPIPPRRRRSPSWSIPACGNI